MKYAVRLVIVITAVVALTIWWWPAQWNDSVKQQKVAVTDLLSGTPEHGFARAVAPKQLRFPADHAAHPDFQSEWWYFTGNLFTREGARFGYQLTLFRFATGAEAPASTSTWRDRQIFMGHLTLTAVTDRQFLFAERFSRTAVGLAGASTEPARIWIRDWVIQHLPENDGWQLSAAADNFGIALVLRPERTAVLHGERGLSRKSGAPGNASYYYSYPRLATTGSIQLHGQKHQVTGTSWLDREWSTSALDQDQTGWDWFSLQLSDGSDLMYYRLRDRNGGGDPFSNGTLVAPDGGTIHLTADDVTLEVLEHWRSPHSGIIYPSGWSLHVPRLNLRLDIHPVQPDQELNVSLRYWEGAVDAVGKRDQHSIEGRGYVELAGYAANVSARRD
jgi:predicted secreted hydrolase